MVSLEDVAHKAIEVSLGVKSGETVWIHGWDHTIGLISLLAWECRRLGCQVFLTVQPEDLWLHSIMEAPLALLDKLSALQASALKKTDAYVFTLGPRKPVPWNFSVRFLEVDSSKRSSKNLVRGGSGLYYRLKLSTECQQ